MSETIPHWLTKQADQFPHQIAITTDAGQKETFQTLKDKSIDYAQRLTALGVRSGDHIGVLSHNCLDMVITIHASSYIGATVVLLNTRLSRQELIYQVNTANVRFIITTETLKEEKQIPIQNQYTYEDILMTKGDETLQVRQEINLDEPFTMMFTSGTTGFPKAVVHTYGNHWWSAIGSLLNLGFDRRDKWLLPLPMFHVGGFSILIRSVIYGMHVYMMGKYERHTLLRAIQEEKITIASLVTLMLGNLIEDLEEGNLSQSLRTILLGGGAVPENMLEMIRAKNIPVFQSYGMTETSSQIVTLHESQVERKIGSSGKALFPAQVKVLAAQGDVGEIVVKGPMVFHGYYHHAQANKESFTDGWFHTGDLGYVDEEGFLFVVDRRSDLIISGGENIYPSEIEHVLLQCNGIKEAAVVGKEDDKWGQVPIAYLVVDEAYDKAKTERKLSEMLASYKIPKETHIIDALPRNATNKIMRHKLVK